MLMTVTNRLGIRALTDADLVFIKGLRDNPMCARYQRWESSSEEHLRGMIDGHREDVLFSEKEIQRFLIVKHDDTPVGTLTLFVTPDEGCITLGITIAPTHQRQGYARELLTTVCHSAHERFPTLELIALIHPDNTPSIRLFEQLGFTLDLYAESLHSLVYIKHPQK